MKNLRIMEKLPGSPGCFVCDNDGTNPRSLHLHLMWDEENGEVCVPFEPDETWCGYSGVVHGGILASIFDDAMGWAIRRSCGEWVVTADFHICYRKPVTIGRAYTVRGRVEHRGGRKTKTGAYLTDAKGVVFAEADALFVSGAEIVPQETEKRNSNEE
ncbi:MAG: PaaI family thioesterase [Synergistaceae bacterium]|nr:PaaI family thioesterase [Synergistaceae bacterium]